MYGTHIAATRHFLRKGAVAATRPEQRHVIPPATDGGLEESCLAQRIALRIVETVPACNTCAQIDDCLPLADLARSQFLSKGKPT